MDMLNGEQLGPSKHSRVEFPRDGSDFDKPGKTDVALITSRRELWAFYLYYVVRSPWQ